MNELIDTCFGSANADLNALQMMVRAVITFLIALVLIRFAGIRSFGSKSAFDIVLSITMGAVLSRCITGKYSYLACVSAATVLALMHRLFAMIAYHSKWWSKFIKGEPHYLLKDNKINWENMKLHNLSPEDLEQAAHKHGLHSIDDIHLAIFETDGKVSIIPRSKINFNGSV
jgi:uncharacterized membrane protein YcaP (DUF421 family)